MAIFVFLIVLSFLILKPFLITIFVGALLAYALYPIYKEINLKLNKSASAVIVCLIVFFVIVLPSGYFLQQLVQQSYTAFLLIKQKLSVGIFTNCSNNFCESIHAFLENPQVKLQIQDLAKTVTNFVVEKSSQILTTVPQFLIKVIVMFFSMFYFLKDGEKLLEKVDQYLGINKKEYSHLIEKFRIMIHGLTYGYFVVALVQGILGGLLFLIFGIASPLFWGLFMCFLALIPIVGASFVWVPAAIIFIIEGTLQGSTLLIFKGVLFSVFCLILIGGVEGFLKPKLMGSKANVHPVLTFLGILGGIYLFGVIGVILGPLLLGFTAVIIETYLGKN